MRKVTYRLLLIGSMPHLSTNSSISADAFGQNYRFGSSASPGDSTQLPPVMQEVKQRFAAERYQRGCLTFARLTSQDRRHPLPVEQDAAFHSPSAANLPAELQLLLETPVSKTESLQRCSSSPCEPPLGIVRVRSRGKQWPNYNKQF